jgi:hypothetical protein
MGTIVFVLFALDSSLAGVLGGVLLFRLLARRVEKNPDRAEKPVTKVLIIRPDNRAKDYPEKLLKNAAAGKTPASLQQIEQNLLQGTDVTTRKNASTLIKQDITLNQIVPGESESINHKTLSVRESHKKARQTAFIRELETNLTIAIAPWKDRPVPFQTTCWEAKLEKVEPSMVSHLQDLIQLYADISLANNVVWLATEIGHRSKELDESYLKLCSGIAERIKWIIPMFNEAKLPIDITS